MNRAFLRLLLAGACLFATAPARAATWTDCGIETISYYVFFDPVPTLLRLGPAPYFEGEVATAIPGETEYRIVEELVPDPIFAPFKGDVLYAICAGKVKSFEMVTGVASRDKLSNELYLLKNAAEVPIGVRFHDRDRSATGGGIAVQAFFRCDLTVGNTVLPEQPVLQNAAVFHTGADLTAIDATAAQIEQYWASLIRQRIRSATEAAILLGNPTCVVIDKTEFVQLMNAGAQPLVHYQLLDPAVSNPLSVP